MRAPSDAILISGRSPDPAQHRVLRDEHVLVFLEGALDLGEQFFGRVRLVLAITVGGRPHEPAGMLGLRRDAVEDAQAKTAVAGIVLIGALADIEGTGELQDAGRRDIFELAPAVDTAAELHRLGVNSRRHAVEHPAYEFHAVRRRTDLHLGALIGVDIAGKRRLVNIGAVRLIEQIVRQQQIVALDPLGLALVGPRRMPGIANDRLQGLPAPDRPSRSRPGRRAPRPERRAPARCSGSSPGREFRRTCRRRRTPCRDIRSGCSCRRLRRTTAACRDGSSDLPARPPAVGGAIEHDRLVEQRPAQRLRRDLAAPGQQRTMRYRETCANPVLDRWRNAITN